VQRLGERQGDIRVGAIEVFVETSWNFLGISTQRLAGPCGRPRDGGRAQGPNLLLPCLILSLSLT
jgi:hypothetical protein